jgi:hypothetical protein
MVIVAVYPKVMKEGTTQVHLAKDVWKDVALVSIHLDAHEITVV